MRAARLAPLILLAALAVAVSLLSSGDVSRAQQTVVALVSNTSQSFGTNNNDQTGITGVDLAVGFSTSDHDGGYALTALDLKFAVKPTVDLTISLWDSHRPSGSSRPDNKLFEFDNPSTYGNDANVDNTFTAPAPFYLHEDRNYFIVAESDGSGSTSYYITNTTSDDETGVDNDWSIFNQALGYRDMGDTDNSWPDSVEFTVSRIPMIAIHGYELDRLTYNTGESTDGYYSVGSSDKDWLAQGFFTSGGTNGWDLHSVALDFGQSGNQGLPSGPGHITVSLYSAKRVSGDSVPDQKLLDFNDPPLFSAGDDNEFTAPEGSTIAPSTAYLIVIRKHGGDSIRVRKTSSAGQDGYSAFSIRDVAFRSTDGNSWEENDDAARMKLYGKSRSEPIDSDGVVTLSPTSPGVGVEITATLADADGSVSGESWQWSSADSASGTFSNISGATSNAYTPVAGDVGNFLKATVSYTDAGGTGKSAEAVTDSAVVADREGVVRTSTENPVVGQFITAGIEDADGVIGTLSLQWSSASNATGPFANIPGETSQTYTPVTSDIGKFLKVTVNYDDGHGPGKSAEKVIGSAVVAATTTNSQPEFDSSENGRRSVAENDSGASVGSPLAATDGNSDILYFDLSGSDSNSFDIGENNGQLSLKSGVSLNYEADSSYSFSVTVSDRKDANGDADTAVDDTLSVTVSVTNRDEDGTVRLSTNSPSEGREVTASLSDPDGSVSGTSWRWSRANSINGTYTNITGATSRRYTPDDDDVDKFLRARVTYTDGHGPGKDASRKSTNAVSEEASVDIGGVVTLSPRNPAVGVDVTAELHEYDGPTSGESWQWSSSSSSTGTFTPISGATSSTYTPVAGDAGEYLKAKVEYTDGHGPNKSAEAVTVNAVASETEPTGNRPSEIMAYWTDSDTPGSNLQNDCAGTEPFRAFWDPPKSSGNFKRADEWEAELTPKYGASNVSFAIRNTGGNPRQPELTGSVRTNGFSMLSIRVRGRFGDDGWGAWSPRTGLYCNLP